MRKNSEVFRSRSELKRSYRTHTSTTKKLMSRPHERRLNKMMKFIADSLKEYTEAVLRIKNQMGLKIIIYCCGTTREHLRTLIRTLSSSKA